MHWWPRQTPSSGISPASCRMASRLTPPSSGRPGPGEISTASGCSARMPRHVDGVVAEHDRLGPELAQLLDQVVDEGVVVVDDEHPRSHGATIVPECARSPPGAPAG